MKLGTILRLATLMMGLSLSSAALAASVDVVLPNIFNDNMVLQRDVSVPIWGTAAPGEAITVEFNGQQSSAQADAEGKWIVHLKPMPALDRPSVLSVAGSKGKKEFKSVLVGEVWLCSGQSNMQASTVSLKTTDEIQDADNPNIRLFTVPRVGKGAWNLCTTDTARGFSAVGYYFAVELAKTLSVPVGMIVAAEGSSAIETWLPPEGIKANESLVDQNGKKLVTEMERFQRFYTSYETLPESEKRAVFSEHCKGNYFFARTFLDKQGELKMESADSILWHMTVIKPAFKFNSMIKPLAPYGLRGFLWYQGETNSMANGDPQYALKQKVLAEGWRKLWNQEGLPFYFVQIAPCESYPLLADFWVQQYTAARIIPHSSLVSTVDVGELKDAHPKNKRAVGTRLALLALHDTYGRKEIVFSGPTYKEARFNGRAVEIAYDNTSGGLKTGDGLPPNWFEVAGSDKKFVKAEAKIVGDKVVVKSSVKQPNFVRYAWSYLAQPNLQNTQSLPAVPFSTAVEIFSEKPSAQLGR